MESEQENENGDSDIPEGDFDVTGTEHIVLMREMDFTEPEIEQGTDKETNDNWQKEDISKTEESKQPEMDFVVQNNHNQVQTTFFLPDQDALIHQKSSYDYFALSDLLFVDVNFPYQA